MCSGEVTGKDIGAGRRRTKIETGGKESWICLMSLKVRGDEMQSSSPLLLQISDFALETPGIQREILSNCGLRTDRSNASSMNENRNQICALFMPNFHSRFPPVPKSHSEDIG
jgi:hypothetical protein